MVSAVGLLQFEVASWRMEHEFRSPIRLESSPYTMARRTDDDSVPALRGMRDVGIYRRANGIPMALFRDRWQLERILRDHPELTLDQIVTS
jgi:peptide chain release factor 3